MTRSREQVAAFLAAHVVDSAEAARILGFAHRTGLAYHVRRGIDPVARLGGTDVYARAEIEEYAAGLAARRAARTKETQ